jgi:dTDP-4-dehydrorhamnose 3,5-epimerase
MEVIEIPEIAGVKLLRLPRYLDERGWFVELRKESWFGALAGKSAAQTNVSLSHRGVIRGLHYHERGQDDLFCVLRGVANVVVFDRRAGSPTEDRAWSYVLDAGSRDHLEAIYIPGQVAHGFEALTGEVIFLYHVTEEYRSEDPDEHNFDWDDSRVAHLWKTKEPVLSARDQA